MLVNLKAEMARYGITTTDIARIVGREARAVKNRINGIVNITGEELSIIRDAFFPHCSLDYLLSEEPKPRNDAHKAS